MKLADRLELPLEARCSVEGCIRIAKTRKLCQMHYTRLLVHGDTGIVLTSRGRQYSAHELLTPKHDRFVLVPCQNCGQNFRVHLSRMQRGAAKFCSKQCYAKAGFTDRRVRVNLTCAECGKQFDRKRSHEAGVNYCSDTCRRKIRCRVSAPCQQCGQSISFYRSASKRFCSNACYGAWKSANASHSFSRGNGGKRTDLNGLYVRSSWEANWARYLNYLIEKGDLMAWSYEPDTFHLDGHSYTPDFKLRLPDGRTVYHEVKGWMDAKSVRKLELMQLLHPGVSIEVIAKPAYEAVRKSLGSNLNWELS